MKFDESKYKVYTWKHPLMLHWIVNPGLAVNELLLGQRVPKVSLMEKDSDKPRFERSFVPCPHCNAIHDGRTWSTQNKTGFKNWYGLFCPTCEKIIPCLSNLTSLILLTISYPIRILFFKEAKQKWLNKQKVRYQNVDIHKVRNPYAGWGWIYQGLIWAFLTFSILILWDWYDGSLSERKILIGIPIWAIAGLGYGYWMKMTNRNLKNVTETA